MQLWCAALLAVVVVSETDMAELYLVLETADMLGLGLLLYLHFRLEDLVDAFHRGKTLGDIVAGLGEVLQGVDDAIEDDEVVDEGRAADDGIFGQDERAAKPEHDDDHHRAEKLAHRVGHLLADVHLEDVVAIGVVDLGEARVHLVLRTEGLDDAQAAQRLLHLAHRVAPQGLRLDGLRLQLAAHHAHEPAEDGHEDDGEERQLPTDGQQGGEIDDDQDGILEEHVERGHDRGVDLLYVATHAGDDVALALLAEEAQRERRDLLVELVADVAHHARADGNDGG